MDLSVALVTLLHANVYAAGKCLWMNCQFLSTCKIHTGSGLHFVASTAFEGM